MALFLNQDEVAELTGKVQYRAQVKVLNALHIPFVLNAANRPIVARATVERILGVTPNLANLADVPHEQWKSEKMRPI